MNTSPRSVYMYMYMHMYMLYMLYSSMYMYGAWLGTSLLASLERSSIVHELDIITVYGFEAIPHLSRFFLSMGMRP